jgi:CHAT domain-containing protein/Tfp pilus assembly protein PilF
LEAAGLEQGDTLLAWKTITDMATVGLCSVQDWYSLELQQSPRGPVILWIERKGLTHEITVAPGVWQAVVGPVFHGRLSDLYLQAESERKMKSDLRAAALFQEIALASTSDSDIAVWAWLEAAAALWRAGIHSKSEDSFVHGISLASAEGHTIQTVRGWLTLANLQQSERLDENAERSYAAAETSSLALPDPQLIRGFTYRKRAEIARKWGHIEAAHQLVDRALQIYAREAPYSMQYVATLNAKGMILDDEGYIHEAIQYYETALDIASSLDTKGDQQSAILNNLAIAAVNIGDYSRAEEIYKRIFLLLGDREDRQLFLAGIYANLGALEHGRDDFAAAETYFKKALAIYDKMPSDPLETSRVILNLGRLAIDQKDYASADRLCTQALEMRRAASVQGSLLCYPLDCLALAALQRNSTEAAKTFADQALRIAESEAPNGSLLLADLLERRSSIAFEERNFTIAEALARKALSIYRRISPNTLFDASTLHRLAKIKSLNHEPDAAEEFFRAAIAAAEAQWQRAYNSEVARGTYRSKNRSLYFNYMLFLIQDRNEPAGAFDVLERWRAGAFLALLGERDLISSQIPEHLHQARRRLAREYDRILQNLRSAIDAEKISALEIELEAIRKQQAETAAVIRQAYPEFAAIRYPQPIKYEELRSTLDTQTVLLSYSLGNTETFLFVAAPSKPIQLFKLPIGEDALRRDVALFRELVYGTWGPTHRSPRHRALLEKAASLYSILVKPAEAAIAAGSRVMIVPDGSLHLLPWAALVRLASVNESRQGLEYFAEWRPLHVILSATVYREVAKKRTRVPDFDWDPPSFVGFADPALASSGAPGWLSNSNLKPLPFTRTEVGMISILFPASHSLHISSDATEENAKKIDIGSRYVHFAAHTLLSEKSPLDSAVVLAAPEPLRESSDNGLLQAWEIFDQVRLGADLVVLSACESALGKEQGGEGLISLTRAFQYAGARSVLASLWKISDRTTAELMVRFYKHLKEGKTKDEALRAAQIELIRGPIEITNEKGEVEKVDASAPYYWAAFQLYGDWQ